MPKAAKVSLLGQPSNQMRRLASRDCVPVRFRRSRSSLWCGLTLWYNADMKNNFGIFHLYDIRGKYPDEFTEKDAHAIGHGFVNYLKTVRPKKQYTVAVGYDSRSSSPVLFGEFTKALCEEGCNVIDIGLITSPMLYFAVSHYTYDAGAMVTASHNPNPYNGLKLTREKAIPFDGDNGIFWIRDYILQHGNSHPEPLLFKGSITEKNIEDDYVAFNMQLAEVEADEFKGMRLALDAGNGTGGPVAMKILEQVGVSVEPLCIEPDGTFPNHVPDPLILENLHDLIALMKQYTFHLGVALDGDADRIIFVDEKGAPVSGDIITALMSKILLGEGKDVANKRFLYDIRSSNVVRETIETAGGIPVEYRIGHALIKKKMREESILFGGELSGHYYWGNNIFFETPFVVLLKILKELQNTRVPFSELLTSFRKYYHSGEINFQVEDKEAKIKQLQELYEREGKVSLLDGLRVDFPNWWFLVRPSNTESVLRLVIEADSFDALEERKRELTKLITQ